MINKLNLLLSLLCLFAIYTYIVITFIYSNKIIKRKISLKLLYGVMPIIVLIVTAMLIRLNIHLAIVYIALIFVLVAAFRISFSAKYTYLYWAALNFIFHLITLRGAVTGIYALFTRQAMFQLINNKESYLLSLTITMWIMSLFLYWFNKHVDVSKISILLSNHEQLRFVYRSQSVIFIFNLFCTYAYYFEFNNEWFNVFHIITSVMTLISYYIIFNFSVKASMWQKEDEENRLIQRNMNLQLLRSKEKQVMYDTVRKYNHDVKNLIYSANILLNDHKYDQLQKLLSITEKEVHANAERVQTFSNNNLVDSLLYQFSLRCQEMDINFEGTCAIPDELKVLDIDLSRIFNNLTDNAIEACTHIKSNHKKIIIKSKSTAGLFTLLVQNTYNAEIISLSNSELQTTKKNKEYHGIGIMNIKEIVAKYDGQTDIKIDENNGLFNFYVIFTL